MDHLEFIIAYEQGDIDNEVSLIAGFQAMINDGTVWKLQGHYGRMAANLIEGGHCTAPNTA